MAMPEGLTLGKLYRFHSERAKKAINKALERLGADDVDEALEWLTNAAIELRLAKKIKEIEELRELEVGVRTDY